jgi:hypothetical protein
MALALSRTTVGLRGWIDPVTLQVVVPADNAAVDVAGAGRWCPPFPGFFLCYPSRRQQPAALSIDTLRQYPLSASRESSIFLRAPYF